MTVLQRAWLVKNIAHLIFLRSLSPTRPHQPRSGRIFQCSRPDISHWSDSSSLALPSIETISLIIALLAGRDSSAAKVPACARQGNRHYHTIFHLSDPDSLSPDMKCAHRRQAILGQGRQVVPCLSAPVASERRLTDLAAGRTCRAPGSIANDFSSYRGTFSAPVQSY